MTANDLSPQIILVGTIPAYGYFLLERHDDNTVSGFTADQIYTGALKNTGQVLELRDVNGVLIDSVSGWFAGDVTTKATTQNGVTQNGVTSCKATFVLHRKKGATVSGLF